jgi:hypothetical protein
MHIKKFVDRLTAMASSPEAIDGILKELNAGIVSNRITHKDITNLKKQLKANEGGKPLLQATKKDVLPNNKEYEFTQSDQLGMQVKEGDLMYKRTFEGDVNKLLQQ